MLDLSILLGIFLVFQPPLANAGVTTTIDPRPNRATWDGSGAWKGWGIWEGWGVSLGWWAKAFGDRDDLADLFFSSKNIKYNNRITPGLNLNIVRYNAGASSYNSINGTTMVASEAIKPSRQMEGFWQDSESSDPFSHSWDWSVDANQREMLSKAHERGANIFELYSNSPMWWMCYSHNPSGNTHGYDNNLRPDSYVQHAIYLATIAERAERYWNISFSSIAPFNEPMLLDWNEDGAQEGCHYDVATQSVVMAYLREQLKARGLDNTDIAASDEALYDQAMSTWISLTRDTKKLVDRINVHGYHQGEGHRRQLHDLAANDSKKVWNSAYGEDDATGKLLVSSLMLDLTMLHPSGWLYGQPVDGSDRGLIDGDIDELTLGPASKKFFLLAQFTRHIRPGMMIVSGGNDNTIAAWDAASKKLVIVAVNWAHDRHLTFKLKNFGHSGTKGRVVRSWITRMGKGGPSYASRNDTVMGHAKFRAWFYSQSVQTFEVDNVVI